MFTGTYNYKYLVMVVWLSCGWLIVLERNSNLILLKMTHTFHCLFLEDGFLRTSFI